MNANLDQHKLFFEDICPHICTKTPHKKIMIIQKAKYPRWNCRGEGKQIQLMDWFQELYYDITL